MTESNQAATQESAVVAFTTRLPMRALLALAVLLGLLWPSAATLGDNGLATYTGRKRAPNTLVFGNDMITEQALQATLHIAKDVLKGTWRPVKNDPALPKQEVHLECLNSVAPEPLNWKMWCPGRDATVMGWTDKSGAAHRQITLRPQAAMTSTMYQWFITTTVLGLMPPIVEFKGHHYHYYHLWHPLDHVESAWAMGPKVPILQKGPPIYVLIHERYRNPANFTYNRHYETNGWFYVENAATNLMKNRYVINMPYMGIPTWTMILEFNDTPKGLVVDVEVIAGVAHKGFDDRALNDGYKLAAGMNELFTAPMLSSQKGSFDWDESINAITRHVIEEFSNLRHFVPYLYKKSTLLGKAGLNWVPTLGTWLQNNHRTAADSASVSLYHMLEKLALLQVNSTGTLRGKVVDGHFNALNKTLQASAKALTTVNEHLSRGTFVPISNKLTKLSHDVNELDLGFWVRPVGEYNPLPHYLLPLAAKKAGVKHDVLPASKAARPESDDNTVIIHNVPHDDFVSLTHGNDAERQDALKRVNASIKRAKRREKRLKPTVSISSDSNAAVGNSTSSDEQLKVQVKFWNQQSQQQ